MKKEEIISKKSNKAIGPYSQAVKFAGFIFVSGQIGLNPKTNELVGPDIKLQTRQALNNLKNVLEAGKSSFDNVIKVNVYLTNMDNFPVFNEIYAKYFNKPYPARATIGVNRLPKGALIEIECIAFTKGGCCQSNCC